MSVYVTYTCIYIYMYMCACMYIRKCIYIYIYMCVYMCVPVCMYVNIYMSTYRYIHIYTSKVVVSVGCKPLLLFAIPALRYRRPQRCAHHLSEKTAPTSILNPLARDVEWIGLMLEKTLITSRGPITRIVTAILKIPELRIAIRGITT